MLSELRVKNFAIVEDGTLNLGSGMTAFTGETGAGKSLLLDAITLLLGAKARSDMVRANAKLAEVEGVFDLSQDAAKIRLAREMGFEVDPEEGSLLIVRREISAQDGKNRVWIQGSSATRAQLQELLGNWVEVSGQHEFLRLGREDFLLGVLDQYAGTKLEAKEFANFLEKVKELQLQLAEREAAESQRESRLDYLKFQIEEFEKAEINFDLVSEEQNLIATRARLGSVEKIRVATEISRNCLDGGESSAEAPSQAGLQDLAQNIGRELRPFEGMGSDFADSLKICEEIQNLAFDLSKRLGQIQRSLESDPEALERAEVRLSQIQRLKRKYNQEVEGLVKIFHAAKQEQEELLNSVQRLDDIKKQLERARADMFAFGKKLFSARQKASESLSKLWQQDVRVLGMKHATLKVQCEFDENAPGTAFTRIQALFSANPGESPKSLGKVASGGELSRVMLALKHIVAGRSEIGVYLFDEVDAGIGGETAQAVGLRLREIAHENQVLVVTHLAQIASYAHAQFAITKSVDKGRTRTLVEALSDRERADEIARMLGDPESGAARKLALELLERGKKADPKKSKRGAEANVSH